MAAKRYSVVFYVALLVAIGATYGVYRVIESTKASNRIATAPVVVASRDIGWGEMIDRLALTVAQWPVATVPVGAYGRIDSVAGRVAKMDIFMGEPLVPGRLAPEGTTAGLASKITPGKRAMAVRINDVSGVAGMIQPESRVDILLITTPKGSSDPKSKLFMENMRVIAMQTATQASEDGRPIPATVATLEVTPEEFELLGIAQAQGSIQLALRGYGDPDSVKTRGATPLDVANALRAGAPETRTPSRSSSASRAPAPRVVTETLRVQVPVPAAPPAPVRPESSRVEVIRGGARTEVKLPKDSARRDTTARKN